MHFYKAKYDAATPTRVQVNVPTNTDYMVGTELYVKGEKKDIAAENVTLKDGTYVYDEGSALSASNTPEFTFLSASGNQYTWRLEKDWTIKSNLYQGSDDKWHLVEGKDTTQFKFSISNNPDFHNSTIALVPLTFHETTNSNAFASLAMQGKSAIVDYPENTTQVALLSTSGPLAETTIPAGTIVKNNAGMGIAFPCAFSYSTKSAKSIQADTTVNGIPAFTMKSLDVEADKLYDVEFKSESTTETTQAGLEETDDWSISTEDSYRVWTAKKSFTLVPNVFYDGTNFNIQDNATDLHIFNVNDAEWVSGNYAIQPIRINNNVQNCIWINTQTDLGDKFVQGKLFWSLYINGQNEKSYEVKVGDKFYSMNSKGSPAVNGFNGTNTKGEDFDYKFKLFINEDEQSYGDINPDCTSPAEVSAIVDEAIAAYDSQLSTVNLSGTFDDDSTFSYNFVIKN